MIRTSLKQRLWLETLEARTVPSILWDNGTWVTGEGDGFEGAYTSSIEDGRNTFGFNARNDIFTKADNFTVPKESAGWAITSFVFHSYQTGSSTTSTYTAAYCKLWDGVPGEGGNVIAASENILAYSDWTYVYRVTPTTLENNQRPVMYNIADVSLWADFPPVLGPGTYWIEFSFETTGGTGVGVWANVTVPASEFDDGRSYEVGADLWSPTIDGLSGLGHDYPFLVEGEEAKPAPGGGIGGFAYDSLASETSLGQTLTPTTLQTRAERTVVSEQVFATLAAEQTPVVPTLSGVTEALTTDRFEINLAL